MIQITDVYTLDHLASVKTLVADLKEKCEGSTVISMITGDFLAPYLLSSVDRGFGMMNALTKIPIDYITWGNHEADINHKTVCQHVRNFPGKWINSNMRDHEAMDAQQEYDILTLTSPNKSQTRKVGLVAVLSDAKALYAQFKSPGAFGGATIDDPWETLERLQKQLTEEHHVDTILPLQHTYVPDDYKTCQQFDFPVVLSGHDHHRVDEVVSGTRLLKPGMDAIYATVLELSWPNKDTEGNNPKIKANFVKTSDWEPEPTLNAENEQAYGVLAPLRNTELARVPPIFMPLSSTDSRGKVCTMGQYICTLLRSSLNTSRRQRFLGTDAVLLMGGNIRGGTDYPDGCFFSLEALEAEIKSDEVISVIDMPGWLLVKGVQETHAGDPIPGWMQYDHGIVEDFEQSPPVVTQIRGRPIDHDLVYRVATKIEDLTNGQSPSWTKYYKDHPELLPPKGSYVNVQSELMSYFAKNLWRRIWDAISEEIEEECDVRLAPKGECEEDMECNPEARLDAMDKDGDGILSVDDIKDALSELVGLSVDDREDSLAQFVHSYADTNGSGQVTIEDFQIFCDEITETYQQDSWRLSYSKPLVPRKRQPKGKEPKVRQKS